MTLAVRLLEGLVALAVVVPALWYSRYPLGALAQAWIMRPKPTPRRFRDLEARGPLPPVLRCHACGNPIWDVILWRGKDGEEFPMHTTCVSATPGLKEVRREKIR